MNLHHEFQSVIAEIIRKVASNSVKRVSQPISLNSNFSAIEWADNQSIYPKVYWQSRNSREEIVALGAVSTHSQLDEFEKLGDNQRFWGVSSFDSFNKAQRKNLNNSQSSQFFLPQIELIRFDKEWSLNINLSKDVKTSLQTINSLTTTYPDLKPIDCRVSKSEHLPQKADWLELVNKALLAINQKQFKKVVLARQTILDLDKPLRWAQLLKASSLRNYHSYHFMYSQNAEHSFLGSTPECLFQRKGLQVQTEALAGTSGRGETPMQDIELANWLMQDVKNLNEIQLVVDDIIERLTPLSQKIEVEDRECLVRLRKVQHLKREISTYLQSGVTPVMLLKALQPTAAVAGLPRVPAIEFINNNEPFNRGWYSGSFGFVGNKYSEFCVAIRSAILHKNKVTLFAGAGIVPGSDGELEWQELDKKTSTLLSLIQK